MTQQLDPQFHVTLSCCEARWTLVATGELDLASSRALPEVATELAQHHPEEVDLDLEGVSFIDSAGYSGLVAALDALDQAGVPAAVASVSPAIDRFFDLVRGLDLTDRTLHPAYHAPRPDGGVVRSA